MATSPPSATAGMEPQGSESSYATSSGPSPHPSIYVREYDSACAKEEQQLRLELALKTASTKIGSPFASARIEGLEAALQLLHALPPTSHAQEALTGNYISPIFHRLFPRRELALAMAMGGLKIPKLTPEGALAWTTVPVSASPSVFKDVTLYQQELGLRVVQGLCSVSAAERQLVADSLLLPVVVEAFGCCLQQIQALAEKQDGAPGPVEIDPAQEAVLVAMIDAVEAALHFNPRCLVQLVQLKGIKHLLDLAMCPAAPVTLRCSILDTFSFILQEVQPYTTSHLQAVEWARKESSASPEAGAAAGVSKSEGHGVPLIDRASATKFDSAVRDWLTTHNLTTVAQKILALKDVNGVAIPQGTSRQEQARLVQRHNRQRERKFAELLKTLDNKS